MHERTYWEDYQKAFSEMLSNTSSQWAPWHVIPADRKWFARIAVASILVKTLTDIDPRFPTVDADARRRLDKAKAELLAEAPKGAVPDPFAVELAKSSPHDAATAAAQENA